MVRKCLLSFLVIAAQSLNAQDSLDLENSRLLRFGLGLQTQFNYNSTAIDNKLAYDLLQGNPISDQASTAVLDRSGKVLRAGFEFNRIIEFSFKGSENGRWSARLADRQFAAFQASRDVFGLIFKGNKAYEGKSADLGNCGLSLFRYQQVQAVYSFLKNNGRWSIGLSFLNGEQHAELGKTSGSLFTDTFGIALDVEMAARLRQSDPEARGFFKQNGKGFSVDITYSRPVQFFNSRFEAGFSDLGMITWNKNSISQTIDTAFTYEGFEITDLFSFSGDTLGGELSVDSLQQKFIRYDTLSYHSLTPFNVWVSLQQRKGAWYFAEQLSYKAQALALPRLYFEAGKMLRKGFSAGASLEGGGYGWFGAGFNLRYSDKNNDGLLRIGHVEGLLLPHSSSGLSLELKLQRWF